MTSHVVKKLSAIALGSLSASVPLIANANDKPMEMVTVTAAPIRDSQQAAFDAKKFSDNYVEIISSDTIGRFPDQNLADSLGRLPGLAIERDQGQARYINLRGAPFRYTSIAFDGIDVPGAENGRIPRFDSIPSVITRRIAVNKAILPSMPGESVAGFINIETFSPFTQEGWSFAADVGLGEQDLGGGDIEKYGLRTSWSNDKFGFVVFTSDNSREQITDTREYDLERDANTGELIVNELDFRSYKVKREDSAYGGTLEFRGEDKLQRLFLSTLYSEFIDSEQRNQFVFAVNSPEAGTQASNKDVTVTRALEDGEYQNSTFSNTLGADFQVGEWRVEARANSTETEFSMNLPIPQSVGGAAVASYDLSDIEDPKLYLDRDLATVNYAATIGIHYGQELNIDGLKLKVDAERDFEWFSKSAVLRMGLQRDSREADGYIATPSIKAFPGSVDIDSYNTGALWDSNTTNTIGGTIYDNVGLRNTWAASGDLGPMTPTEDGLIAIQEEIIAAYAMATTEFDWGNVVAGARFEQTDYSSKGSANGNPVNVEDDFNHILPSIHFNINLADNLKLRISGSTGVNRPTYNEWRAAARIDVIEEEINGGNPRLKAEEAMGIDTAIEWYFAPASILSAGMFYRTIDKVIYADTSTIDPGIYLSSAAGESWTYSGAVNGKDGEMQGLELNFVGHAADLIDSIHGLGVSANITVLDSEFTGIDGQNYDLPGTSDLLYNFSVFYEDFGLSARLNYQYRDEWISPIEDPSEYWGEQERVDLSISYELPFDLQGATMSVYANANNLTNETDVRYAGNGTINQSESYGRRYLLGVRLHF
ncbi:Vitamin B12 transporter BtuB [Zhongshania aliphaticivorans]|uniref:Vitamin B12 transporter BtuB n=1 Tax=Zhongshania aliphaticivorans TaxID=1470434 RepID=A0A5S9MVT3_9GAMM|nr:TonB-dependent receptor [Zhongshania aliphaticivorans]CAA0080309.1 Vitamin B12 transporter BtuB [Zhongshania aliphaticivorans]CAA0085738.1 Vitamin B12 transporter BtuB [Zhongshania aliphaticivorans]